jgi:hypothetical protein
MYSSSSESGLSQVHRRVICGYFHSIGFPHRLVFVLIVYHIPKANGEEFMNSPLHFSDVLWNIYKKAAAAYAAALIYAGYILVTSSKMGIASENTLISQG